MSSIQDKIQSAASKNKELLAILAETDYAPPALNQQNKYISDLQNEISKLDTRIKRLEANRQVEFKEHEKYRDSVMKRFAYKMTRKTEKFEARASKEEKEYFDALHEEHQAKEARKSTADNLAEAQTAKANLEPIATRQKQAQKELDDLYDSIFEGPTPDFPEEDAKENAATTALQKYHTTRTQSECETQALQILTQAKTNMRNAALAMDEARSHSRMDMFGGGTITDMMERSALARADQCSMQTQLLISQAQRISPHVSSVPKPSIAQGNLMSDVFFDNIFTDMDFHEKIKRSQGEVMQCLKLVEGEEGRAKGRLEDLRMRLVGEGRELEESRVALQRAREEAFERTLGGGAAPPVYSS